MKKKKVWLILVIVIFLLAGFWLARRWFPKGKEITVQSQDRLCQSESAERKARYLGLSCQEFNTLTASVHEYFFQEYPFTRWTDFGIAYEREEGKIWSLRTGVVTIYAAAHFRTPPVVLKVVLDDNRVWFISEETTSSWE